MSNQLSNGLLARRRRVNPLAPITLTLAGIDVTVNAASITIPSTAQVGDIAVFAQFAYNSGGAPSTVEFPGATTVVNGLAANSNWGRVMSSYKVLTAGDINTPLTGMTGSVQQKTVRIIRPSRAIAAITYGSEYGHAGTSSFLDTIDASPVAPAFVFGRLFNTQSALQAQGTLVISGDRFDEATSSNYRTYLEIQNGPSLSSRTFGTSNSTGILLAQGYYAYVS
jgi:hypothetical protein